MSSERWKSNLWAIHFPLGMPTHGTVSISPRAQGRTVAAKTLIFPHCCPLPPLCMPNSNLSQAEQSSWHRNQIRWDVLLLGIRQISFMEEKSIHQTAHALGVETDIQESIGTFPALLSSFEIIIIISIFLISLFFFSSSLSLSHFCFWTPTHREIEQRKGFQDTHQQPHENRKRAHKREERGDRETKRVLIQRHAGHDRIFRGELNEPMREREMDQ